MATVKSDVITLLDSTNPSDVKLGANISSGKFRLEAFSHDNGSVLHAAADVLQLVEVPAGATIWGIYVIHGDLDGGGSADYDIGDSADDDRFVTAQSNAAQTGAFLPLRHEDTDLATKTFGVGFKYTAKTRIELLINTTAWVADQRITGFVMYSVT